MKNFFGDDESIVVTYASPETKICTMPAGIVLTEGLMRLVVIVRRELQRPLEVIEVAQLSDMSDRRGS